MSVTLGGFLDWLSAAKAGDSIRYYSGRSVNFTNKSDPEVLLFGWVYYLACNRRVFLLQERLPEDAGFSYIAVKASEGLSCKLFPSPKSDVCM